LYKYKNYFLIAIISTFLGFFIFSYISLEAQPVIPKSSIRLRILANSDNLNDQIVKRRVRDKVISFVKSYLCEHKIKDIEEARKFIKNNLTLFKEIAQEIVQESGFFYAVNVTYGRICFPTKIYGYAVYPAGFYEGLLITLGKGKGQNWWCVLFPPLCFVNLNNADALEKNDFYLKAYAESNGKILKKNTSLSKKVFNLKKDAGSLRKIHVKIFLIDKAKELITRVFKIFNF